MYCIGLIGNIASGKSTVANLFKKQGAEVISADAIAKQLTAKGQAAFVAITAHFGNTILTNEGELNRRLLRDIIFSHPDERLWLEQLLHPLIRQEIQANIALSQRPLCVIEIPLLRNRADYPYLNRIVLVKACPKQRLARITSRDHTNEQSAMQIMQSQPSDATLEALADDIIVNDGTLITLAERVATLSRDYLGSVLK